MAHVEEGQAAPRRRPQPSSRILTAEKGGSQKVVSAILNIRVHEGGAMRLSTSFLDRSQPYIL